MAGVEASLLEKSSHSGGFAASKWQALYNMLCFTIGAGMLGLPHALLFARDMYFLPVVIGGLMCFYSASLLNEAQIHYKVRSYPELGMECGGPRMKHLVKLVLSINQAGIAVLYVLTVCKNIELLRGGDDSTPSWYLFPCIGTVTFVFITRGQTMSHISGVSTIGFVAIVIVGLLIIVQAMRTESDGERQVCKPVEWPEVFAGLGSGIFSFGGHPVYPDVQGDMETPADFAAIIRWAFLFMTMLFFLVTAASWTAYGCSVNGYILDNMEQSIWRSLAVLGITIHLVAAIPVVLLPMAGIIEAAFAAWFDYRVTRLCIVALVVYFSYMFPEFTDILSLFGGLTENLLVFVFPILFHFLTFRSSSAAKALLDIVILLLSLAILTVGSYSSLSNLIANS